ncbi:MAG: AAA family ATPase, partial [Geminicoccaceae bacterium]
MAATIESWLIALDLERYREVFAANDVDLRAVPHLTDADLRELGISLGHRRIILAAAAELNASEATRTQGRSSEPPPGKDAEFRVLSILFCDLVGSTQLSQRLDPEAMRDLLRRYQDAVAGAVTRYQGHLAKYLGDGVLAYFGWPVAHEDHAERAVRAGREALQAVAAIRHCDAERLAARVGIATGQVIVGDLVGESGREEAAVAGETANLAARIQSAAFPGQLLVAAETARLVGGMFDLEDLGLRELKGFEHPWQLLLVRGERAVESRFEATRGGSARALVGRVHELGNLTERWAIAREGRGQAIQIVGEAGIGKSRLIEAFLEQLGVGQQDVIRLQCSPYHTSSSLYPVIERLRRLAGFAADDEPGDRARKLARMAADVHDDLPTVMPLFAELLSVDVGPAYPSIDLPPAELKERILDLLTARLVRLAARMPLFIILEDAHWIDPSTEELLSRILRRMDQLPVMLAITHRPDWQAAWSEEAAVATIPLGRLDRDQIAALMAGILGRHPTERLVDRVLDRTDGVPLFVEELTRALAEAAATETDESASIPLTIQASLMSRLDRLHPSARATALVASVIGREFDAQLLREVTGSSTDEIEDALDQLQRARLIVSTGSHADGFSFRHALIQETAYRALLAPKRRHNHARIADALARRADIVETQPEMVARHWTEAGQGERALAFWHRAARRSLARAANHEAVDQSERAL